MKKQQNTVFLCSLLVVVIMGAWGILNPLSLGDKSATAFNFLVRYFGWLYLGAVSSFLLFCIFILFSRYGKLRLGPDDSTPEYSNLSWFAMLFSAGMAIGLIFWGVAEPLNHFIHPPDNNIISASNGAMGMAFRYSYFHWGLHAWANYTLLALAIAYFQLRKGKPALISSIFIPLIGEERANGTIGHTINILAIFATIAGIATDLGLGVLQMNSGLKYLYNIDESTKTHIIIIVIVTICFMASAIRGLDKGIKKLSNINMVITLVLVVLVIAVGPTTEILKNYLIGFIEYFKYIIHDSLPIKELLNGSQWLGNWTIFYWAWWIAWTPFVSTFIARISKGRTIREFIMGVLIIPSLGSFFWFAIFGTIGMKVGTEIATEAIQTTSTAFFVVIDTYPLGRLLSLIVMVLLATYFVTSADSSTFVLGMLSSNGNPNPSNSKKIIWGLLQSFLAMALLLAGGLEVLQTASIVAAFPFVFIMIFSMFSLGKALKDEKREKDSIILMDQKNTVE
ncbi:BCCT family transporter [Alkaliphilus peptidifermentans]|uniref:Glycine betaine transporter n=1 Tax=Alkaliphilus peptidifermentans DSM 18978 TaxID=1120976 RepID=A0A1G5JMZ6_9FIRM|nr:BCCT family transporter [Alkaliphilus peptidifermentans]SCY89743.1 glycine betaine transporter [Alkaliphilus peptidifermentans DSM 18978]